jgi:hypothetical protein
MGATFERAAKPRRKISNRSSAPRGADSELKRYAEIERWFRSASIQNPNDATARNDNQAIAPLRSQVQ